jgi:hypothetical protein
MADLQTKAPEPKSGKTANQFSTALGKIVEPVAIGVTAIAQCVIFVLDFVARKLHLPKWLTRLSVLVCVGLALTMVQVGEFAGAIIFFMISALIAFSKAVVRKPRTASNLLCFLQKGFATLIIFALFVTSAVWTNIKRI